MKKFNIKQVKAEISCKIWWALQEIARTLMTDETAKELTREEW